MVHKLLSELKEAFSLPQKYVWFDNKGNKISYKKWKELTEKAGGIRTYYGD